MKKKHQITFYLSNFDLKRENKKKNKEKNETNKKRDKIEFVIIFHQYNRSPFENARDLNLPNGNYSLCVVIFLFLLGLNKLGKHFAFGFFSHVILFLSKTSKLIARFKAFVSCFVFFFFVRWFE